MKRGFTLIELMATMLIVGIIATLGVVSFSTALANGRDAERKTDVETIGRALDTYFRTGGSSDGNIGTYPTTVQMNQMVSTETLRTANFPGLEKAALFAPGQTTTPSLVGATNTSTTTVLGPGASTSFDSIRPQPDINMYVYQPLTSSDKLCNGSTGNAICTHYNIYYVLERGMKYKMSRGGVQ